MEKGAENGPPSPKQPVKRSRPVSRPATAHHAPARRQNMPVIGGVHVIDIDTLLHLTVELALNLT